MPERSLSPDLVACARRLPWLRRLGVQLARVLLALLVGGLLGTALVRMAPGYGVDQEELDSRLSAESLAALRQAHAGDGGIARSYLHALVCMAHGDLGVSQSLHMPVRALLAERFPETLKTIGQGLAVGWLGGLSLALLAVLRRAGPVDVAASLLASALLCVPAAVMALLFVMAQAPGRLAVGLIVFPKIFHYAKNLLARSAELPHVLTARAKGAGAARVLLRHVLPVAAPQLLALAGVSVSLAFAAAIPVEALCDLPGIGQLAWQAAMGRDLTLLVDLTMLVTVVTLLANGAAGLAQPMRGGVR